MILDSVHCCQVKDLLAVSLQGSAFYRVRNPTRNLAAPSTVVQLVPPFDICSGVKTNGRGNLRGKISTHIN